MQQIINFVFKNSTRMLFLLLLITSLTLTIQSHSYHRSTIVNSTNILTGTVFEKVSEVNTYFNLREQNNKLAQENATLRKILFNQKDSTTILKKDSLKGYDKIDVIQSRIINNSYNVPENYLTINSGSLQGIKEDMGVVNSQGIVGIVEKVSPKYATILSVLNIKSQINAKVKKSNHFGSLVWNAKNAGYVQLIDVPRLATVKKGDTVVTGGRSTIFPENIPVGIIDKIYTDTETNYYTINVRLFNDMTNLNHVYIISNKESAEINKLEKETIKANE
ncbi:rod shape-determining protein MreC [Flavobacterium psychrophilum]|nr:rod shape-determining protein MreC [Flavobacterium psychrophilum]AIG31142.1 rod shape-determining protein MreC [Flavobacterium psychrophilum]AIG33419.1 rod shape-determining protein MreC [Flavobacterium psychrophilum]AIG35569.1 rod shape-determining protein MreC [Flavobacterium psychrophilum]AIG37930.1 rod shape-determining protein MreC [Flavobacterium psychrophilum]AIG40201.1 rod shape-determining protein MreC [Flavobacterium psychrophilum]